ncbi:hypothetical protein A3E39_01185 [Candidatus Uhrbacteria bacterium RIFCSPHIGHO2_12_FULL_60_25]|uniref:Glycosyltransferase 2-like domain-containing protein n=1 Tax=Candidatus Uhrbacteria bacterium RIFCSPHIGHO2_12_FULL_60_25 TaxID=1802399 RepID=A0A1F7UM23_9BACT|nr:MAG: hypothetical protein A3D73_02300 [Candidatus Uhrbacteria bacterium RIFCSPHIGHO2_02_FULL_60_44]OGL78757.1 MAG: hypothetical protein A3E39_01185 [Candidatus Uhrbacteria bacterium RIFCSPHIGHO2_12_FULL_60_25]
MNISLSIIIPALNEERNIEATIQGVRSALTKAEIQDYEMIIVTCVDRDGREDRTRLIAQELAASDARIRVLHSPTYQLLGEKYRNAVLAATKNHVVMVPGDNEIDSISVARVICAIGSADMVVTYTENPEVRSLLRRLISRVFTIILNVMYHRRVRYFNGINVYRIDQLRRALPETPSFAYAAEILLTLLREGASFVEVPMRILPRQGRSTALRWENLVSVSRAMLQFHKKFSKHQ